MPFVLAVSREIKVESIDATEVGNFRFITEASQLGLRPEKTYTPPAAITIEQPFGNGRALHYAYSRDDLSHIYRQDLGCIELVVLND